MGLSSKIATPEQRRVHGQALRGLFLDCSSALGFSQTTEHQEFYPDVADYKTGSGPSATPTRFKLRLWQLGIAEVSHVKGAPPLHGIRDCMQKFLVTSGAETDKYPLEVLFHWPHQWTAGLTGSQSHSPDAANSLIPSRGSIDDFTVALSIGSSVSMACQLLCWAAIKLDWMGSGNLLADNVKKDLAERLLKCLCFQSQCSRYFLHQDHKFYFKVTVLIFVCGLYFRAEGLFGICNPKNSVEAQSLDSLRIKTDASSRSRPSICNMHFLLGSQFESSSLDVQLFAGSQALSPVVVFFRFDRIVTQKQNLGSRKTRHDLLQEAISKHNKQAVGKARVNPDEISALYVFDQAPQSVRRLLKVIWGTEAPQYTAITLGCIALPHFNPGKPQLGLLRVQREANPLWYEICRHSWAKVEETLVRMQAKWDMKIKEYLDRNQAPPIHQQGVCSAFRDAGKEQEVYVMACLMVHFQSELKASLTGPQFEKLMQNWRCGWLDSKLLPEIVAMRADFKIGDINSHTVPQSRNALSDDLMVLQDEEIEEGVMTLIGLARGMKKEQDLMRAHRTAVQRYSVQTIAAECEWQKSKQAAVEASWTEHQVGSSVCFYYCDSTLSLSPGNKCLKKPGRSIFKWVWARLAVLQKLSSKLLTVLWLVAC